VLSVFSTFAVGGPQVRFATLANRLGRSFRHAIIAMDGEFDCAERLLPGLDIAYPAVGIRKGETLGNAWRFRQALRQIRPDVLVTYNWGTIEWALANAWPLARHVHIEDGFGPEEQSSQIPRRVLMRRAFLRRRTVVVPSRTLWRIATEVWRLPESQLRYIPNGIDLTRFAPAAGRKAGGEVVIGTVAALRAEKNLVRLLRAFRLLPESAGARLVVVGDGPDKGPLEALAAELGLGDRVRFAGHFADPSQLYQEFDLFALSSDTEQMPLSVLEAMAAGLPVVATDVGDVRAMLAPENASFVVPKSDEDLAAGLRRMVEDAPLRAQLGAANRARAEQEFDERAMVGAYRALFAGAESGGAAAA
jgi:glycosyltransferase involved in cell wall biosynthesis